MEFEFICKACGKVYTYNSYRIKKSCSCGGRLLRKYSHYVKFPPTSINSPYRREIGKRSFREENNG